MGIAVGNHVHRGVMALSVHAPYVNMMNTEDALDVVQMLFDFMKIYSAWCLLKEKVERFLEIFYGMEENEDGNADGTHKTGIRKLLMEEGIAGEKIKVI